MYISLDMKSMRVVHKHHSLNTVAGLVHIELPDVFVVICMPDMAIKDKTDLEIKLLFRSCFPGESDHIGTEAMKQRILSFIDEMPLTDADPDEVKVQADSIRDNDKRAHKYVRGAFTVAKPAALFGTAASSVTTPSLARPVAPPIAAQRTNAAPRGGSVRETIWKHMDEMWEKAGKPSSTSVVFIPTEGVHGGARECIRYQENELQ